ncbi:hypothetical protein [Clostridium sp.]|nr:hypothetical protein [Clostridium sp.]
MKVVDYRTYMVIVQGISERFYSPANQPLEFRDTFKIELIPRF